METSIGKVVVMGYV